MSTMAESTDSNKSVAVYVQPGLSQHTAGQITHPTQPASSPFLSLSGELRNMVYIYALGCHTWRVHMSAGKNTPRTENASQHALALLQVNRQIYEEARLFPYIHSTFHGRHNGHLHEWTQCLSTEHRSLIASVKFDRRGYIVKDENSGELRPSPTFWMDIPCVVGWNLGGLRRIEVELSLLGWGWLKDKEMEDAKADVVKQMRRSVEEKHPGMVVDVYLKGGSRK